MLPVEGNLTGSCTHKVVHVNRHSTASIWNRFRSGVLSALVAFMMKNSKTGPEGRQEMHQPVPHNFKQ